MRPLLRGDACLVNEAGISVAGNPLTRAMDAVTGDALHAQQLREGYLGGHPMGPMMGCPPGAEMLRPMMGGPMHGMDAAWQETGPRGPMLGDAMPEQMRRHMEQAAREGPQSGFFAEGPLGGDWAMEFGGARQAGPRGPGMMQGMSPSMQAGPDMWAQEFGSAGRGMEMDMAFRDAQAAMRPQMGFMGGGCAVDPMLMQAGMRPQMGFMGGGCGVDPMLMQAMMQRAAMRRELPVMQPQIMQQPQPAPVAAPQAASSSTAPLEAAWQEAQQQAQATEASDAADLAQAAQMVEMLRNSGNPKFMNSKFVSFIDKVSKGDLHFKENTVVDRDGHTVDWDSLYDTEAAQASDQERMELQNLWRESGADKSMLESMLMGGRPQEEVWKAAMAAQGLGGLDQMWGEAGQMEALQNAWKMAGDEEMDTHGLEQAWMGEHYDEQMWGAAGKNKHYEFQENNQFLDCPDPLAEAQRLIREGRDREALLCLEAEVQRNPESSEGWRLLGQLYAEMDQDIEAIQCLRKGHEVDPYNLDSLLALGVSCTNELDQLPALRYLREWIENHEDHQVLVQGLDRPADYEYEAWRNQVTALFNQAAMSNPLDVDVFVALGVMENINRNYDAAVKAFATACRLRPNDHTCWNKLGATLANSGRSAQAVIAYHQGLQLKPNYARSWSNLAIAHANLHQHGDAARFYLSSLVLNPEATHIWGFLHSAVLNMGNVDAMRALDERDLPAMKAMIEGVLDPATLPKPAMKLERPPEDILAEMGL